MRQVMTEVRRRWGNGAVSPVDLGFDGQRAFFAAQGGRLASVGVEWTHGPDRHFRAGRFFVLPDRTGVVLGCANNGQPHEMVVINADDQVRFVLRDPVIHGADWAHGPVHLELPRMGWPAGRIPFGPIAVWRSRRDLPAMLELDWDTGEVLGFELLPRFF